MIRARVPLMWLGLMVAVVTVGCGGHGSTSFVPRVSSGAHTAPTAHAPLEPTSLTMHLTIPRASSAPALVHGRRPLYISANTLSMSISIATINGSAPSPSPTPDVIAINYGDCTPSGLTYVCSATLAIPPSFNSFVSGTETLGVSIAAYSGANATGSVLSETTSPISIALTQGTANAVVNVVLSGNDSTLVAPSKVVIPWTGAYTESSVTFTVTASDPSGSTITTSNYVNAISVSASAVPSSETLSLTPSSIPSPNATSGSTTVTATLSDYVGSSPLPTPSSATITVTAGSVSVSATIVPMITTNSNGTPAPPALAISANTIFANNTSSATFGVEEPGYGSTQGYTVTIPSNQTGNLSYSCHDSGCIPSSAGSPEYITITDTSTTVASATPVPVTVTDANGGTVKIPVTTVINPDGGAIAMNACTGTTTRNTTTSGLNSEIFQEPNVSGVIYQGPSYPCINNLTSSGTDSYYQKGCNGGTGYMNGISYGRWEFDNSPYTASGTKSNEAWSMKTNGQISITDPSLTTFSSGTSPSCTDTTVYQASVASTPLDFIFNPNGTTQSTWAVYILGTTNYEQYTISAAYADAATFNAGSAPSSTVCTTGGTNTAGAFDKNDGTNGSLYTTTTTALYRCPLTSATAGSTTSTSLFTWSGTFYPSKAVLVGTSTIAVANKTGNRIALYSVNNGAGTGTVHYVTVPTSANSNYVVPSVAADPNGGAVWATVKDTTDDIGGICRIDVATFYESCFTLGTSVSTTFLDDLGFDSTNYLYVAAFDASDPNGDLLVTQI